MHKEIMDGLTEVKAVALLAKEAVAESEKKSSEVKTELEAQITEIEATLKKQIADIEENSKKSISKIEDAINNGFSKVSEKASSKGYTPLTEKEAKTIAQAIHSQKQIQVVAIDKKTIRFGDATSTNTIDQPATVLGSFEINRDIPSTILDDVDVLPAINENDGSVAWNNFDESLIEAYEAKEMDSAQISKEVVYSNVKLQLEKQQAKMNISSDVIINVISGGKQVPVLERNIAALNRKFEKKVITKVFKDIIQKANDNIIGKIASTASSAPADAVARKDLRNFLSTLKQEYIGNSVIYVNRQFINAIFSIEASDGHLPLEQFRYENGIQSFVTPEGIIPIRQFEHAQIGNYKSLSDGTTDITSDWVNSNSGNAGKLLAFVGDLKYAYKVIPSSIGFIGYSTEASKLLEGATVAGKISYVAQGVVGSQGIKVLYAKA
ncbi:MAG: hypothetical protein RIR01_1450 [Bacteroidota bacterium]|jgi:hypothetical protein